MLKNYIKTAIRNSFRSGTTSIVNFLGLIVGLVCSFLIFLYVNHELSYDKFHEKSDRIFRVLSIDEAIGISNNMVGITIPGLAPAMKREIPQVEEMVRILGGGRALVEYEDNNLYTEYLFYWETSFLDVFDFKLKHGDPKTCLEDPNGVIVTQEMASKIFGDENPMGRSLTVNGNDELKITGVFDEVKDPSHIKLDMVISMNPNPADTNYIQRLESFQSIQMTQYALLSNPEQSEEIVVQMDSILRRNNSPDAWRTTLQPLEDVHLKSQEVLFDGFNRDKGNISYVKSLSMVAIIIILIASFNYMNLSTARSAKRAREVGVRKTVGGNKPQLVLQHLSEAIVLVALSMIIGLGIVEFINNLYQVIDGTIYSFFMENPQYIVTIILLVIVIGVLSGIYPAVILSAYKPQVVLKGKFETGKNGMWLRRFLVVLQFVATFVMIVGTIVVVSQLKYTLNKDKGFDTSHILNIRLNTRQAFQSFGALKTELERIPGVEMVATSGSMPGRGYGRTLVVPEGTNEEDEWIVSVDQIDENYIPLMGMNIKEGKNFHRDINTETVTPVIVNQAMVDVLGWDDPVDKIIDNSDEVKSKIIGVIEDFHFTSMRHQIEPIMILYRQGANRTVSVKLSANNINKTIKEIEQKWDEVNEGIPFEYTFFDETFGQLYAKEQDFSKMFFRFTLLSIFVAILGLFGLAAFSAEQRTKEIGIRKAFGASSKQMIVLQSHEYTKLIILAMLIATPIAIFIMNKWLQSYVYRIDLDFVPFIISALIVLAVTLLTVSIQSYKAAQKNPATTLKYE